MFTPRPELVDDASVTAVSGDPLEDLGRYLKEYNIRINNFPPGEEAIFRNTIGAILAALGLLIPCMLRCDSFRQGLPREGLTDARI